MEIAEALRVASLLAASARCTRHPPGLGKRLESSSPGPLPARRKVDYKWIALSVTTIGALMAAIDSTIVILALPDMMVKLHAASWRWCGSSWPTS